MSLFEDFRNQMDDSSVGYDEVEEQPLIIGNERRHDFLGMTPMQRFIGALLLLMMIVILGTLFLLATSKIVPPFLG